ncbi:sigma-54-dependent transcriptional regulator [Azomonas macrocytogenes]|uniref:Transcriptional regulator with AAA-type ATPase domain n=1 Tax=Azomonas macrocytogenes TaxID=69962 RepID=A0A839T4B2_AZOMA|nr:sigma-54 dependent transcriptional regulator [Azomonas macrocytogenes]MBB3104371.1 transcriptional regulator with AAA-type ATPase domain [Azomonas macrocytogenes]
MLDFPSFGALTEIVGESPAFRSLQSLIERVAPTDHTLLVCGPTGSGKEVVARQVHACSLSPEQPFVDVNCGAIPENLIESELFGHARGAFTGAISQRPGYFQQVGRGTLFLDEIGELPLSLQTRLLRVLETRNFRPIGSNEALRFEGRVVAATHRDLLAMVQEGRFREDLYYRLAVFVLEVPGLEQRREDIPALVKHFAARQSRQLSFSPESLKRLSLADWPGHVRQLRNLIDRLGVLAISTQIDAKQLEPFLAPSEVSHDGQDSLADALLALESDNKLQAAENLLIDRALQRSGGNKSAAALLLGVNRKVVERRLKSREAHSREAETLLEQGRQCVEAAEFRQAIPLLRRCLERLPKRDDVRILQFEAYRLLGVSLRSVNGWLCTEACACYEAALQAGEGLGDGVELASMQFGIWATQLMTLELSKARATAQNMLQRAHDLGSPAALDEAHVAMANTLFWLGDCEEAIACLARGGLLQGGENDERSGLQGFDLNALALTFEGLAAFQLGAFSQARQAMQRLLLRCGKDNPHPFNRALALQGAAWLACLFEDRERLGPLGADLESLSETHGFTFYRGIGQVFRGCHIGSLGAFAEAERFMLEGYQSHMLNHGGRLFHSFQAWQRGELLLQADRPADCESLLTHALDLALEHQERTYLSELQTVKARARWAQGDPDGAEQELRSALSTAMALDSVSARIAAATQLAQLLRQTHRCGQAAEVLARALRGVALEVPPPSLIRALQLLAELGAEH